MKLYKVSAYEYWDPRKETTIVAYVYAKTEAAAHVYFQSKAQMHCPVIHSKKIKSA